MTRRFDKRKKKYLGSRTCGGGNTKNRRGKGRRGGRGMYAGAHKHRYSYIVKYEPEHFGKHGFHPIIEKAEVPTINVGEIHSLAKSGKLEKKENMFVIEFKGKVLGAGEIALPVSVRANSFSKGAEEKIKRANGKCETIVTMSERRVAKPESEGKKER
ncbi:MAG: uL15 family ribosomal protein [Candidatus Micrarchaeia archaeon]